MTDAATQSFEAPTPPFYRYVLLLWALITAFMIFNATERVSMELLGDPDNYMRLAQVRDWLDGQAWTDLTQHRMNPPHGGDLHWSRLVDMPIAAIILVLRQIFGQLAAESVALLAVPALLLLALMMTMATLLRELAGRGCALAMTTVLPGSLLASVQFMPMRIDHHGWQLLMASIALVAWTRQTIVWAVLAGAAVAFWMHVSIEGLPYAMLFGGLYAFAFVRNGDRRIHAYLVALTAASLILLVGTRGPALLISSYCDAISAPYITALVVSCSAFLLSDRLLSPVRPALRIMPPLVGGLSAIVGVTIVDPSCLAGPFASLDPVVRDYWYLSVKEGLPFWRQTGAFAAMLVLAPIPGVCGAIMAARGARGSPRATTLMGLALAAIFSWLLGMVVMRAGGVAQLYALPGMAAMIVALDAKRDCFRPRIGWAPSMAGAFLLATALPAFVLGELLFPGDLSGQIAPEPARNGKVPVERLCVSHITSPMLQSLGDELLFAPIDVGPLILYHSKLKIIAAGYHRNSAAMAKVIGAFTSPAAEARATVLASQARQLLFCPNATEVRNYIRRAPNGLAAALAREEIPDWLKPDPRLWQSNARLYTIIR